MRRCVWLALVGLAIAACSGGDFGKEGTGGQGGGAIAGSASGGANASTAGSTSAGHAGVSSGGSQSHSGAAGNGGRAGASSGGSAGVSSGGHSAGVGGMVICPPCAAPPAPDCVGSGPCGCGPYVCPSGGAGQGEQCGPVVCTLPLECCNPLTGTCTKPGQVCLQ